MFKSIFYILLISAVIFTALSCQEIFNPSLEKPQKELLVVEGSITNMPGPYTIRLSKAIGFNESEYSYADINNLVTGATVSISDDQGNSEILKESGYGNYSTSSLGIQGIVGRTYTLNIKTSDGLEYSSKPEKMAPPATNILISTEIAEKNIMEPLYNGNVSYVVQNGINIKIDLQSSDNISSFYKFDTRVITETRHLEWRSGRCSLCNPTTVFCWFVKMLEETPSVKETISKNGINLIKQYTLGFEPEAVYDMYDFDIINDPTITFGWLISSKISSISEKEFLFYSKLNEQLSANSKLFDPLPTQLYSNISCVSDESKTVLGYFSVSSQSIKDFFVRFNKGDKEVTMREIAPLPSNIYTTCQDDAPPYFWEQAF